MEELQGFMFSPGLPKETQVVFFSSSICAAEDGGRLVVKKTQPDQCWHSAGSEPADWSENSPLAYKQVQNELLTAKRLVVQLPNPRKTKNQQEFSADGML